MAANFRINTSRIGKDLHLNLNGDFDGSSAWELLNNMADLSGSMRCIFIHTNGLKKVHPFGQAIFESHFSSGRKSDINIILVGADMQKVLPLLLPARYDFVRCNPVICYSPPPESLNPV